MRNKIAWLGVTLSAATLGSVAMGASLPFSQRVEQEIDRHQVAYADIRVAPDGNGVANYKWSNGQQIRGNNFYTYVALVTKDNKPVWTDKQMKGLDGSWGGHAREGEVQTSFHLSEEQQKAIDHVVMKSGAVNCGLEMIEFHCCDNGIETTFSTKKCQQPEAPKVSREPRHVVQ